MSNTEEKLKKTLSPVKAGTEPSLNWKDAKALPETEKSEAKAKVSQHFLNAYFATDDTLKNYQGQLEFNLSSGQDLTTVKNNLGVIVSNGFKGLNLSYSQNRVMKGVFSLLEKQGANETRPFIVLDNVSQLYDEILDKKITKKKGKYSFKDFSGGEVKQVNEALDEISRTSQQIVIKARDGYDKKTKKPLYAFYMTEKPLISVEYLKREVSEEQAKEMTEAELKQTGQIKISIMPLLVKDYNKYFKLLPKDISKEVREACPEVKKISEPIVNFIDFLHRQEGLEVRRDRRTLVRELKLEKKYKVNKGRTIKTLLQCYDIAKRTGYLTNYETDQRGKLGKVDVFYLNGEKYYHHQKDKRVKNGEKPKGLIDVTASTI